MKKAHAFLGSCHATPLAMAALLASCGKEPSFPTECSGTLTRKTDSNQFLEKS
jgi:hypothetical protein